MTAQKKSTHTVNHGNLYFSVDGKLQKLKIGHELVLTDDQAKNLGNKVKAISGEKSIDATAKAETKAKAKAEADAKLKAEADAKAEAEAKAAAGSK